MKRTKKTFSILLVLAALLSVCACGTTKTYNEESKTATTPVPKTTYTNDEIEAMAMDALVYELYYNAKYPINRVRLSELDWYDLSLTRYSVASIVKTGDNEWTVKGTISLYDPYGRFKDKGTYTAYVKPNGYSSCIVNIDT